MKYVIIIHYSQNINIDNSSVEDKHNNIILNKY